MFLVDTGSALTILRRDTWELCKQSGQQLTPWCQSKLVGAEGSQLHVFGSAIITLNLEGEIFDLSVVVIDPLTSEAILGLDVLTQCTVDLLRGQLITGAGHVVNMCCQNQNTEWKANLVDVCEYKTLNFGVSTGQSEDVRTTGQSENVKSTGQSENVKSTGLSENVKSTGQSEDFQSADFPSFEEKTISQSSTPETTLEPRMKVQEPQSKGVFTPAQDGMIQSGHVLSVSVIDNVRVPSFSELEILAQTKGDGSHCYMLESKLQNSDLLVARAVVTPGETVPVRLLNPTGTSIILYSGARIAVLSEFMEIVDSQFKDEPDVVAVSSVSDSNEDTLLETLMDMVKDTSLSSQHQDLLLTLLLDYSDVFARSKDELGRTDLLQHEIVTDSAAPIRQQFRRLSPEKRAEI